MERKNFQTALWKVIEPIGIPVKLLVDAAKYKASAEYTLLLRELKNPQTQQRAVFFGDDNLLALFARNYLEAAALDETCLPLHKYFCALLDTLENDSPVKQRLLKEAEHELLCYLIQIYLTEDTKPVFKRVLTVLFLFHDRIIDFNLLNSILEYYNIFNKKN